MMAVVVVVIALADRAGQRQMLGGSGLKGKATGGIDFWIELTDDR
jgi:hypothetical protein